MFCVLRGANLSESEAEQDGEHNITELPQVCSGRGNMASQQSAVRLTEVSVSSQCGRNTGGITATIPERHFNLVFVCVCPLQIGPRMTLQLIKVQEGMGEGNILYHAISELRRLFTHHSGCSNLV